MAMTDLNRAEGGSLAAVVRLLSVRHHAIALMHGLDERRFAFGTHLSLGWSITIAVVVFAGFLFLAIRRLRRMDVP